MSYASRHGGGPNPKCEFAKCRRVGRYLAGGKYACAEHANQWHREHDRKEEKR